MANYIYSTLPTDQAIAVYTDRGDGTQHAIRHILIKGGGQIPTPHGIGFETPLGVVTQVSDDDLAALSQDFTFNHFVSQGFFKLDSKKVDVEKAAGDMNVDVPSAPLSESDIADIETTEGVDIKVYDETPKGKKSK